MGKCKGMSNTVLCHLVAVKFWEEHCFQWGISWNQSKNAAHLCTSWYIHIYTWINILLTYESWADSHTSLSETPLKASFVVKEATKCMKCLEKTAVLRSNECFSTKYLCGSCNQYLHVVLTFHDKMLLISLTGLKSD